MASKLYCVNNGRYINAMRERYSHDVYASNGAQMALFRAP